MVFIFILKVLDNFSNVESKKKQQESLISNLSLRIFGCKSNLVLFLKISFIVDQLLHQTWNPLSKFLCALFL